MNIKILNFLKNNMTNNIYNETITDLSKISNKFLNIQNNYYFLLLNRKEHRHLMNKYNLAIKKDESKLREKIANRCGLAITK